MGHHDLPSSNPGSKAEELQHVESAPSKLNGGMSREDTTNKDDPLNWSHWLKVYIVALVSVLSFVAQFSSALINPGFESMSKNLNVTVRQCSYCTTVFVLFGGVSPLLIVPFANVYGRRILYVIPMLLNPIGNIVSAAAPSYGGVIVGRVLSGIGSSIPLGIGAATICDLFRQYERGLYMGIYTLSVTNGPHLAPIVGGYISQGLGWRWCFWIPAICSGFLWILTIFTLPETLFSMADHNKLKNLTYVEKLVFHKKVLDRPIRLRDFGTSFRMIKYAAVLFPMVYYGTANSYGSLLFAVTGSHIGAKTYKFDTKQTGLFMGIPLTVGCAIGEASAGWVSDLFSNMHTRKNNGHRKAESRLLLLPLCITLCVGTATYGFCIQKARPWIQPAICMAISGFGTQVATTMVYTYCTDSYRPQAGEIGVLINLMKSVIAFNVGFYALPFAERVGYTAAFSALAGVNAFFLVPLVFLIIFGESIRKKQGVPKEHEDL